MKPDEWERLRDLLGDLGEEEIPSADDLAHTDPDFEAELESLARERDESGEAHAGRFDRLFDRLAGDLAGGGLGVTAEPVAGLGADHDLEPTDPASHGVRPGLEIGDLLGPYRLLRLLGRGGMGSVVLAERADGLYEQHVAIKILRQDLLGDEVRRHFLAERQILARLSHPHIAKLLDGGMTEGGRPYLVMEYVQGQPIDRYCDEAELSVAERLKLFARVCLAVQNAHAHLIVHRDIKPSNIVVTPEGHPRLMDFGIAKLLAPEEFGQPEAVTRQDVLMVTPEYASPEQMRREPISTASDVYQLGLLLYELLTGRRACHATGSWAEIEQAVCIEPTPRPSVVVTQDELRQTRHGESVTIEAEAVSVARGTTPDRLSRALRGDLDNIVAKALRKDPERRYQAAHQLAEDVRRYLDGEPVRARPATLSYQTSRFIGRHKTGFGLSAALVLSVLALISVSIRFAFTTDAHSRAIASEASTATEVTSFLIDLFEVADPISGIGDTLSVRTILDRSTERLEALEDQPEVQARLMWVMGEAYHNLGFTYEAEDLFRQAVAVRTSEFGAADSTTVMARIGLADHLLDHANDESVAEAATIYSEMFRLRTLDYRLPDLEGRTLFGMASSRQYVRDLDSALTLAEQGLIAHRRNLSDSSGLLIAGYAAMGGMLRESGALDSAEVVYARALDGFRTRGETQRVASTLNSLGILKRRRGDLDGAEQALRESLQLGADNRAPASTVYLLWNLASVLSDLGRRGEAEAMMLQALSTSASAWPSDHWRVGNAHSALGEFYLQFGSPAQAEPRFAEAVRIYETTLGLEHSWTGGEIVALAHSLLAQGRSTDAESGFVRGAGIITTAGIRSDRNMRAMNRVIAFYESTGRPGEAAAYREWLQEADSAGGG